jgi:hypothetical protein
LSKNVWILLITSLPTNYEKSFFVLKIWIPAKKCCLKKNRIWTENISPYLRQSTSKKSYRFDLNNKKVCIAVFFNQFSIHICLYIKLNRKARDKPNGKKYNNNRPHRSVHVNHACLVVQKMMCDDVMFLIPQNMKKSNESSKFRIFMNEIGFVQQTLGDLASILIVPGLQTNVCSPIAVSASSVHSWLQSEKHLLYETNQSVLPV